MSYLAIIAGLALLFGGGEAMLRGAVGVARKFHLSEVFVGVAIVGFATSRHRRVFSTFSFHDCRCSPRLPSGQGRASLDRTAGARQCAGVRTR